MGIQYPTVNYIGNKEKVAEWIIESLPIKGGVVLDLFCGGCSVSYLLKAKKYNVISNDALYSNYILAKAIVENSTDTLSLNDFLEISVNDEDIETTYNRIKSLSNKVYFDYEVKELAYLVNVSKQIPENKRYVFLSLLRRAMIRKIPYSRMNVKWEEIQKFRNEEYSYKKYGRYRHYHNIPFLDHIKLNLEEYNGAIFDNGTSCFSTNKDALECLKELNQKVDLIYMDPPYPSTMNNYESFYGGYDLLFDKKDNIKLDLTNKATFLENFSLLIKEAIGKAKYIAISLNNKCYPSVETLVEAISPFLNKYEIKTKEHVYKVTGKENKHTNYEILLICELKEN